MITTRDMLFSVVYPLMFAAVMTAAGRFVQMHRKTSAPWAVALAIVGGFAIAFVGASGKLSFPPAQAQEWLPFTGAVAVIVSILATYLGRWTWSGPLSILLLVLTAWLVTRGRRAALSGQEFAELVGIAIVAGVVWWIVMSMLASRMHGGLLPLLLSGVFGGAALVLVDGGTQRLGQIEGAVAIVLLAIAAVSLWLNELTLARGGILALTIVALGTLWCGYLYADVKPIDVMILMVAPMFAWVAVLPWIRSWRPWVRFAVCFVLVMGVVAIAVVPAAKGLRQTLKEQMESTQY
jgi:hypothetical protein